MPVMIVSSMNAVEDLRLSGCTFRVMEVFSLHSPEVLGYAEMYTIDQTGFRSGGVA